MSVEDSITMCSIHYINLTKISFYLVLVKVSRVVFVLKVLTIKKIDCDRLHNISFIFVLQNERIPRSTSKD